MTYEEFSDQFHIRLNEQQSDAVRSVEGVVVEVQAERVIIQFERKSGQAAETMGFAA